MSRVSLPLLPTPTVLASELDASVNFITPIALPSQALEARFVRRSEDYIVAYVSPQTACAQACRFCHLTATGQVKGRDATVEEILAQAEQVLTYFAGEVEAGRQTPTRVVHYNFMARGEALASQTILSEGAAVMEGLYSLAKAHSLTPSVKISTIGTERVDRLLDIFPYEQPDFYYSLYSLDPAFRRRWLPNAPEPRAFLEKLQEWQRVTHKIPTLHHAIIEGHNDDLASAEAMIELVNRVGLRVNVNIVRYNPPTAKHGQEADELCLEAHLALYQQAWPQAAAKVVKKVGYDVAASCGMFVGGRARG